MKLPYRATLRTHLTLLYVSLLFVVLVLYAGWTSVFLLHNLLLQLDLNLDRNLATIVRSISAGPDGRIQFGPVAPADSLLEIWSADGALLYRSDSLEGQTLGPAPSGTDLQEPIRRPTRLVHWMSSGNKSVRLVNGMRVRTAVRSCQLGSQLLVVRLGLSENFLWHEFAEMVGVLAFGLPAALVIVGVTGYFVARRALRPVASMARRAETISAEHLNQRLEIANPDDELGHLGRAFNETLLRLEQSFGQLKRFTADASHELRSPLTAMRSVGEVALQQSGSADYYREVIGSMLEETNRLTHLVDTLLTLSRADAGHIPLHSAEVCLLDLAKESASLLEVLAEERHLAVKIEGDQTLKVLADRLILRQALLALLDNAVKFSPPHGYIRIRVGGTGSEALIEVHDSGPGISPEHRAKIFERFYRVDKARSSERGGSGLGLSIAQWAVAAHGGKIELDCQPNSGCTFRVRLPGRVVDSTRKRTG